MSDRHDHDLRGQVRSMRCECASLDAETGEWEPMKNGPVLTFDRDGREVARLERTPRLTTVDEQGVKTTEGAWMPPVPRPHRLEYGICFDGPVEITYLTRYDVYDRPIEIVSGPPSSGEQSPISTNRWT